MYQSTYFLLACRKCTYWFINSGIKSLQPSVARTRFLLSLKKILLIKFSKRHVGPINSRTMRERNLLHPQKKIRGCKTEKSKNGWVLLNCKRERPHRITLPQILLVDWWTIGSLHLQAKSCFATCWPIWWFTLHTPYQFTNKISDWRILSSRQSIARLFHKQHHQILHLTQYGVSHSRLWIKLLA